MNSVTQTVGQRIRSYRLKAGLTQELLAEKAELHHTYIGQVERGEKNLSVTTLEKLLRALDVSFSEFFQYMDVGELPNSNSIPAKSYELISRRSETEQQQIYEILCRIERLMDK